MDGARERSQEADMAFAGEVPQGLLDALRASRKTLAPDIASALDHGAPSGTWVEVFGPVAEELFTSYHMARYVEFVASSGKRAYHLPLIANCWLDKGNKPGRFPTGGPVARVMEVWRYAAPSIDVVCPDVYVPYFCDVCDEYRKLGNPLLVPETSTQAYAAAREMWVVGHHHALGFSPSAFEEMGRPFDSSAGVLFGADVSDPMLRTPQDPAQYAAVTRAISQLLSMLPTPAERATLDAVTSERPEENELLVGNVGIRVAFGEGGLPGACMAARSADGSLWLLALNCAVELFSTDALRPHVDVLVLEDGEVCDGVWRRDRRLNGGEVTIMRYDAPTLLRAELFLYA